MRTKTPPFHRKLQDAEKIISRLQHLGNMGKHEAVSELIGYKVSSRTLYNLLHARKASQKVEHFLDHVLSFGPKVALKIEETLLERAAARAAGRTT